MSAEEDDKEQQVEEELDEQDGQSDLDEPGSSGDSASEDAAQVEAEEKEGLDQARVRAIVEAVLMTSDAPVTPGKLQALFKKEVTGRDLRQAVDDLNAAYEENGHAMLITVIAGGFQIVTRRELGPWVRKFHDRSQVRLSQAALETLAIIAFKQPVTRIEVDSVRGVDSGGVLRTLMELNMIRIVGRSEGVGRPMLFGTTRDFMTHFGLRSLADLPKPKELEELLAEGERKAHAEGRSVETAEGESLEGTEPIEEDQQSEDGPAVDPDADHLHDETDEAEQADEAPADETE